MVLRPRLERVPIRRLSRKRRCRVSWQKAGGVPGFADCSRGWGTPGPIPTGLAQRARVLQGQMLGCHSSGVARCLIAWASCGRHEARKLSQSWVDLKLRGASAERSRRCFAGAEKPQDVQDCAWALPSQIMSPKSAASAMARSLAA